MSTPFLQVKDTRKVIITKVNFVIIRNLWTIQDQELLDLVQGIRVVVENSRPMVLCICKPSLDYPRVGPGPRNSISCRKFKANIFQWVIALASALVGELSTNIGDKMPKEAYRTNKRKIVIYCLVELFTIELSWFIVLWNCLWKYCTYWNFFMEPIMEISLKD